MLISFVFFDAHLHILNKLFYQLTRIYVFVFDRLNLASIFFKLFWQLINYYTGVLCIMPITVYFSCLSTLLFLYFKFFLLPRLISAFSFVFWLHQLWLLIMVFEYKHFFTFCNETAFLKHSIYLTYYCLFEQLFCLICRIFF